MAKALLAASAIIMLVLGAAPIAQATTFVVGGTNGVGGTPSVGEMQGLVNEGFIPPDDDLEGIEYPAQLWPVSGSVTLDDSVDQGVRNLDAKVLPATGEIAIVGTSQGAVVINYEKRRLMARGDTSRDITFYTVADPTNSDGGVLAKFAPLHIPILNFTFTGPPPETPYNTVEYVREYDGVADFPDRPRNVVADLNALAGGTYLHPNYGGLNPADPDVIVTSSTNSLHGTTTHYLFPTEHLPLTQPLRDAGVNPALVDAVDKPLRRIIDKGYDGARPGRPAPSAKPSTTRADGRPSVHRPARAALRALRAHGGQR